MDWFTLLKATSWKEEGSSLVEYEKVSEEIDNGEYVEKTIKTGNTYPKSEYNLVSGQPVPKAKPPESSSPCSV